MRRFLAVLALLLLPLHARADVVIAPGVRASIPASGTITLGGTFQTILTQPQSRSGCLLQNTSAHTMYVYMGALAAATLTNSFQLLPGQQFSCAMPGGAVIVSDTISITTSTTADPFVFFWQS
jgi:hypothetical protein